MSWRGRYGWSFNGAARRWQQDDIILKLLFCLRPKRSYCVVSWSYILVGWNSGCIFLFIFFINHSWCSWKKDLFASLQVLTSIMMFPFQYTQDHSLKKTQILEVKVHPPGVHPKWGALNTNKTHYTMKCFPILGISYTIHVWHLYPLPECHTGIAW